MEKQTFTNDNDGELVLTDSDSLWCDNFAMAISFDTVLQCSDTHTPNRVKLYKNGSYAGCVYMVDESEANRFIEAFQS